MLVSVALFIASSYVLFIAKIVEKSVEHYCEKYYTEKSYIVFEAVDTRTHEIFFFVSL